MAVVVVLSTISCQTRVVTATKPIQNNSLDLYQKYTIQTNDAKIVKMEVLKVDQEKIYGKTKSGEEVVINKSEIREAKKPNLFGSVALGVGAVLALILIPV